MRIGTPRRTPRTEADVAELRWATGLIRLGHDAPGGDAVLAERAAEAARLGRDDLPAFADRLRAELARLEPRGIHLAANPVAEAAIHAAFDRHFPLPPDAALADVLDAPWPTRARAERLIALMPSPPSPIDRHRLDVFADAALAGGDPRLLRLMATSRVGRLGPAATARMLDALRDLGRLSPEIIEAALTIDRHLPRSLAGARCLPAVHDVYDDMTWRALAAGAGLDALPHGLVPRGLRFLRAALTTPDAGLAAYLGAARVPPAELVAFLETEPQGYGIRCSGCGGRPGTRTRCCRSSGSARHDGYSP